jgi:hypothetical protein
MPDGEALSDLFDDFCDGVAVAIDFANHIELPSVHTDATHTATSLAAVDTVFLLIRNECEQSVTLSVKHDIAIFFAIPMAQLRLAAQVSSHMTLDFTDFIAPAVTGLTFTGICSICFGCKG